MNDNRIFKESHLRSILKTISYRVCGTLVTWLLVWIVTGDMRVALTVGAFEPAVKTLMYYVHERVWQLVPRVTVR